MSIVFVKLIKNIKLVCLGVPTPTWRVYQHPHRAPQTACASRGLWRGRVPLCTGLGVPALPPWAEVGVT